MATNSDSRPSHHRAVIGNSKSFWLYSSRTGFDLTHPPTPDTPTASDAITIETTTTPITIDPTKTALVIIDMQNFFLSPAFGRHKGGAGHRACDELIGHAIPAARVAGIRVIWLNWGLTEQEFEDMPPAIKRAFGFEAFLDDSGEGPAKITGSGSDDVFVEKEKDASRGFGVDKHGVPRQQGTTMTENGKDGHVYKGLGADCGMLKDPETGEEIAAGRLLMREQWNSALYPPLDNIYEDGTKLGERPDVWMHKNRMSGLWGVKNECEKFLEEQGIRTLLFAGVNTDQCVGGTFQDAFSKGYDCILLSDGCGTTSPDFAQQCVEFNAAKTHGFAATCKALADAVAKTQVAT